MTYAPRSINLNPESFRFGLTSRLLPPERAALGESGLATGWLAKDLRATGADDDGLCVGEDGGDGEAAGALDVHEEGAWAWDEGLHQVMSERVKKVGLYVCTHLQLVLASLSGWAWVEEVDCENLQSKCVSI